MPIDIGGNRLYPELRTGTESWSRTTAHIQCHRCDVITGTRLRQTLPSTPPSCPCPRLLITCTSRGFGNMNTSGRIFRRLAKHSRSIRRVDVYRPYPVAPPGSRPEHHEHAGNVERKPKKRWTEVRDEYPAINHPLKSRGDNASPASGSNGLTGNTFVDVALTTVIGLGIGQRLKACCPAPRLDAAQCS